VSLSRVIAGAPCCVRACVVVIIIIIIDVSFAVRLELRESDLTIQTIKTPLRRVVAITDITEVRVCACARAFLCVL
jgi:hypothetical protein